MNKSTNESLPDTSSSVGLRSYHWNHSYKTSSFTADGRPVNILHDFYIPVLRRATRYDRMAGYFRSSSLASASRGFSAFVGRGGKMRLIVGADMNADDVSAILAGDAGRLERNLSAELASRPDWPADVTRGVELLAWMVAHNILEVRVGFRIHSSTGQPLPMVSTDDGYVHEKWGVFSDEFGHRMSISGSLNESKTALVHNAENIEVHCDWWEGREAARIDEAQHDFQMLWEDKNPSIRVLTLPDAVQQQLLNIGRDVQIPKEIDDTTAAPQEIPPPSVMERLRFSVMADAPRMPAGRMVGLETAPIAPWPHQAIVARRLVSTWPYNHLLCDEVGLGKTIEAGLAIRSLVLSGLARRVLIAAPRSLTGQWQREMATKFLLPFGRALSGSRIRHRYEFPYAEDVSSDSLYSPDLAIVSTGLMSRDARLPDLKQAQSFDIALVDEAHYARRKNPTRGTRVHPQFGTLYRAIEDTLADRTRCLWLATATPMQLDAVEVSDLLRLTGRAGAFRFDPTLMQQYYEILGLLVRNQRPSQSQWEFLRSAVASVQEQDPLLWQYFESAVIDGRIRTSVRQWLGSNRTPRGRDLQNMLRLIFAASPLSRTMLRHTRSLLEIYRTKGQLGANLATRNILPVPRIVMNAQERRAYDELDDYCNNLIQILNANSDSTNRNTVGFMLSFLRLRFASSLFAIRETLRRRSEKVSATLNHLTTGSESDALDLDEWQSYDDSEGDEEVVATLLKNRTPDDLRWERDRLQRMLETLEDISGPSSKMKVLLDALQQRKLGTTGRIKQTVIFTRFYDTLTDIVHRLRLVNPHFLVGTYSGQGGSYVDPATKRTVGVDRDEVKQRFLRGEIDILVCTDAAAEGLNLQTADLLINFDLPWNPMKVEQRIGRIDRIGQTHDEIFVLNLCYADSAEQIVYDRLLQRLVDAGSIVGTQQISMLPVLLQEFQDLAAGDLDEQTLEDRAKERISLFRQRTASMEIPPEALYEIYTRLGEEHKQTKPPISLRHIWETLTESTYLKDLGCIVEPKSDTLLIRGVTDVPDETRLTVDRGVFDRGIPDSSVKPHFASYGDPFFDTVVDHVRSFELPKCVQRLTSKSEDLPAVLVGYAVATIGDSNVRTATLVTAHHQLVDLAIDESAELTAEELAPLQKQLDELATREFGSSAVVKRLVDINDKAARAQVILNLMVTYGRLVTQKNFNRAEDNFWQEIKRLEENSEDRDRLNIPNLPADMLRPIEDLLLFPAVIPEIGDDASIMAPRPLLASSTDASHRVAESMKVKRSDLTVDRVIDRLRREIASELAQLKR